MPSTPTAVGEEYQLWAFTLTLAHTHTHTHNSCKYIGHSSSQPQ